MRSENCFPDANKQSLCLSRDACSLTAGKKRIKASPWRSIRPRANATAWRVDTHAAGMRSQAALSKVQLPKGKKQSWKMTDFPTKTTWQPVSVSVLHSSFVPSPAVLLWGWCYIKGKIWRPAMTRITRAGRDHPAVVREVYVGNTHCHSGGVIAMGLIKSLFK